MNEDLPCLQEAIRHSQGCDSSFLQSETIQESTNGLTIWEGEVHTCLLYTSDAADE